MRALFEIALRKRWPAMTYRLLNLCKVIDKRLWGWAHPLRQFTTLPSTVLSRLEEKKLTVDKLKDMRKDEIGEWLLYNLDTLGGFFFFSTFVSCFWPQVQCSLRSDHSFTWKCCSGIDFKWTLVRPAPCVKVIHCQGWASNCVTGSTHHFIFCCTVLVGVSCVVYR